jgi:hypothetical protein
MWKIFFILCLKYLLGLDAMILFYDEIRSIQKRNYQRRLRD